MDVTEPQPVGLSEPMDTNMSEAEQMEQPIMPEDVHMQIEWPAHPVYEPQDGLFDMDMDISFEPMIDSWEPENGEVDTEIPDALRKHPQETNSVVHGPEGFVQWVGNLMRETFLMINRPDMGANMSYPKPEARRCQR